MVFVAGKEGREFWAIYDNERYGFTTAQGSTREELQANCISGATVLLKMQKDKGDLVPHVQLKWESADKEAVAPNPYGINTFRRLVFGDEKAGKQLLLQGKGFAKRHAWLMVVDGNYVPVKLTHKQSSAEYPTVCVESNEIQCIRETKEGHWERAVLKLSKNRDQSFTLFIGTNNTEPGGQEEWDDGLPIRVDVRIIREDALL